jgi:glutamine amidotransferase
MREVSTAVPPITIADYGMGNVRSVAKAIEHVGCRAVVSTDPEVLAVAKALILPGVGAFPEAMREIERRGMADPIRERVAAGVPLLGICLGMQLLFESSTEHGGAAGLGILEGAVEQIVAPGLKLPHIGWAPLQMVEPSPLTAGIDDGEPFYFVHSLVARPERNELIATAEHGERFAAIVGRDLVFGTQFHPEKSSRAGLGMLRNFAEIVGGRPC